jgi:DNA-binding winged helix-turn-helix (wHTH) protein/tetratricopeptide (TPR) repeat protein
MGATGQVSFGRFRLDTANEQLWDGAEVIALRPKAFAVLKYLLERRGELVTKQQLLEAVWPATFVGDAVLKDCIRQLRDALHDDATAPRYIETAHRRGYRLIAQIDSEPRSVSPSAATSVVPPSVEAVETMLGRDADLARISNCLKRTVNGERQVMVLTGEAGIGKTTVVSAVIAAANTIPGARVARGQCLEQYGAGEAYLPVLDGFARLGRGPGGDRVVELLREHAPAWLRELPSLIPASERQALQQQVLGATRERMLREMADAIEALAAEAPLIVVLEDLHWSDYSTLDLIAYLARRRDPARLMVIGTYRPVEVILNDHPLKGIKRELQAHGLCHELPLEYLREAAIAQYLTVRFPGHLFAGRLARLIHRRTEGNPLFMVNVIQHLVDEQLIVEGPDGWQLRGGLEAVESEVPESVRQLIEKQVERLSLDERRVLEGASVVGMECSSVAIAAGLDEATAWVEERCEALVRRHQFLMPARLVELPDGTLTPRYRFTHILYLEVPYTLVAPMRRAQIHGRIGARGEAIYGDRVGDIAAELAMHFEQGRDPRKAVKYLLMAAENATHRSADHEAAALARRGLVALEATPDSAERIAQEIRLRMILGVSLMATRGFAVAEVEALFLRALDLCAAQRPSRQAFMIEWLLGLFRYFRGELQLARDIAARLLAMAAELDDPVSLMEAHRAFGVCLVEMGRFSEAVEHLDRVAVVYNSHPDLVRASFNGQDAKVVSECFAARALWALGYPDQARERIERARSVAHQQAPSLVLAAYFAALIHQLRDEAAAVHAHADAVILIADEYGLEMWACLGHIFRGWARFQHQPDVEALRELQRGLIGYEATGGRLWRAHALGLCADTLGKSGRVDEGLALVAEALALADGIGEHGSTAELHRLQGELLITQALGGAWLSAAMAPIRFDRDAAPLVTRAQACFDRALMMAREQRAKSWELRVVTSIGRLLHGQGKRDAARRAIKGVHDWFSEGAETTDLRAAGEVMNGWSAVPRRGASATVNETG